MVDLHPFLASPNIVLCFVVPLPLRFQGSGLLQRVVWLPVTHLPFHGQPAGAAPFGRPEGRPWVDGHRGKGESTLPDPWLHSWQSGWVAPWSPGERLTRWKNAQIPYNRHEICKIMGLAQAWGCMKIIILHFYKSAVTARCIFFSDYLPVLLTSRTQYHSNALTEVLLHRHSQKSKINWLDLREFF